MNRENPEFQPKREEIPPEKLEIIDALIKDDKDALEKLGVKEIVGKTRGDIETNTILGRVKNKLQKNTEKKEELDPESSEEEMKGRAERFIAEFNEELENPTNNFYSNFEKKSFKALVIEFLNGTHPELGINIKRDLKDSELMRVEVDPKENKKLLHQILSNEIIEILSMELSPRTKNLAEGEELERKGILPKGTTKRMLARFYVDRIETEEKNSKKHPGSLTPEFVEMDLKKLDELKAKPLKDDEIQEVIGQVIEKIIKENTGNLDELIKIAEEKEEEDPKYHEVTDIYYTFKRLGHNDVFSIVNAIKAHIIDYKILKRVVVADARVHPDILNAAIQLFRDRKEG